MNENLLISITVLSAFVIAFVGLSFYLGSYESGILIEQDSLWQKVKPLNFFDYDNSNFPNPKQVSIEILKKIFEDNNK